MSKTSEPSGYIDPLELARFLVLPRVPELLAAFAAIPPGRLRDTIIEHAQALAEAHSNAPPQYRQPDPLPAALGLPPPPRALPVPRRTTAEPPTQGDPKTRAVKMRLDGKLPYEIAEATGLKLSTIYGAISEARKAGMKFPYKRAPVGMGNHPTKFITSVDQLDPIGAATSGRAAEARGISLEAYMERRKLALEMGIAGRHFRAIMEATKEPQRVLGQWFSAARSAGFEIPYMVDTPAHDETRNIAPVAPNVVDLKSRRKADDEHRGRFVLTMEELKGNGSGGITKGAALMGVDVAEFLRRRREALAAFANGETVHATARLVGITPKQAANWRGRAQRAGRLNLTKIGALRAAARQPKA